MDDLRKSLRQKMNEIYGGRYGYRKTASGHWRERDEPDEQEQDRQSDSINMKMQKRKAVASKERLKAQNKVPTKQGKKMFEDFMQIVRDQKVNSPQFKEDEFARQVYLSARSLEFDKWLLFLSDLI